jgi:hypothetical protein
VLKSSPSNGQHPTQLPNTTQAGGWWSLRAASFNACTRCSNYLQTSGPPAPTLVL